MKILSKQPFVKINTLNAVLFDMRKYRHIVHHTSLTFTALNMERKYKFSCRLKKEILQIS